MSRATLLAYPFRPFFLLVGLYAIVLIVLWVGQLSGIWALPLAMPGIYWHGHEMIFGVVTAAIAGFLLTAMTNWTGAAPLKGGALLSLVLVWVAGRVAMAISGWLPPPVTAVLDLAFLPTVAVYAARVLLRAGNHRNLGLVALLGALFVCDLLMQLSYAGIETISPRVVEIAALDVITVVMVVIGGRIIPAFSSNWLRMRGGNAGVVRRWPVLDRVVVAATLLMLPVDLIAPHGAAAGTVALGAALANGVRLFNWRGDKVLREPLLWSLHLGYLWIVVALALKAAVGLGAPFAESAWLHAIGTGAIATLVLAVMTRVALGHTGRPMRLPRAGTLIYLSILAAAALRLTVILWPNGADMLLLSLAGAFWVFAFGLFLTLYSPILSAPRIDGRRG